MGRSAKCIRGILSCCLKPQVLDTQADDDDHSSAPCADNPRMAACSPTGNFQEESHPKVWNNSLQLDAGEGMQHLAHVAAAEQQERKIKANDDVTVTPDLPQQQRRQLSTGEGRNGHAGVPCACLHAVSPELPEPGA